MNKNLRQPLTALAFLASAWPLAAQTTTPATPPQLDEEVIQLSPFEVSSAKDTGYQATETLAGTRIRTDLRDVASAIQVITPEFLQDVGATNSGTLLQYTTNGEVAGTRGTYLGQGNGTSVDETSNLRNPATANRVRGLAAADNTRDFFITDIPWDSYNIDRIDIQRGPNAILFGLGSPAGIINASTHSAEFRRFASVNAVIGSYGTFRTSLDVNHDLIPKVLAIRVDGMWDDHKYQQNQAFQNDKRFFGSVRFDPDLFKRRDFHTSIKAKFENGDIKADRPRSLPPYDSLTPWFIPDAATPAQRTQNTGLGKLAVPNGYTLGSNAGAFFPWLGGYANQQQPIWFVDGTSNQLYRIYGGYVNTGALNAAGVPQGQGVNLVGQRYADAFSDLTSFSSYALNAKLPNYQYGQYRNRVLTDSSVFDFYNNLIDGPTASQFEKWNATNIDLTQTLWDDRLGAQLTFDHQKYKRGGQALLGFTPTLNIDILQNFQDYVIGPNNASNANVANTNFGRPFVPAGPGYGSSYESDRKYVRGSLFGEVRATDFFAKESFLAKLIGKHRFNGVFSDEKYQTENRAWQMYANSTAYATYKTQGNPDGFQNLPPVAVVYLGGSLASKSTAAGANISGITSNVTLQNGNIYQFASTWSPQPGVVYNAPWTVPDNLKPQFGPTGGAAFVSGGADYSGYTQISNPANYVGWNSNFSNTLLRYDNGADQSLITTAAKSLRRTKSYAGSWQGYLWNEAIIPTLGWRFDEVKSKSVTALPGPSANRLVFNLSPDVYKLPAAFPTNQIVKDHSTAGGVVVHLNKLLDRHDFLPINISLTYNKSNNFQVTDIRRDIYGSPVPNPTGATKEYSVLLSTKDNKYSLRATKYDTKSTGVNTPLSAGGLTGTIKDAMNWKNIKTYYMSGYNWGTANQTDLRHYSGVRYMWDAVYVDNTTGRPTGPGAPGSPVPNNSHLETQADADTRRDASISALNNFEKFLAGNGYFTAWNYGVGPASLSTLTTPGAYQADPAGHAPASTASVYDYRGNPDLQGFAVTADTQSKGYEFEFTANPLRNWRVAFNAAKTTAVRTNVGGPALDALVSYIDTLMAGPGGDLVRFNSDYSAGNELRQDWTSWRGQYTLLKLQEGSAASELRKWRYNVLTNYSFDHSFLKGVGVGAGYRWQDKVIIGYPVIPNPTNPTLGSFDLTKPYYGPSEDALDLWVSYERKITSKINWKIQLNVYNVGKGDKLIPISVEPDGRTWAAARIAPAQEWQLTNTFSF